MNNRDKHTYSLISPIYLPIDAWREGAYIGAVGPTQGLQNSESGNEEPKALGAVCVLYYMNFFSKVYHSRLTLFHFFQFWAFSEINDDLFVTL